MRTGLQPNHRWDPLRKCIDFRTAFIRCSNCVLFCWFNVINNEYGLITIWGSEDAIILLIESRPEPSIVSNKDRPSLVVDF